MVTVRKSPLADGGGSPRGGSLAKPRTTSLWLSRWHANQITDGSDHIHNNHNLIDHDRLTSSALSLGHSLGVGNLSIDGTQVVCFQESPHKMNNNNKIKSAASSSQLSSSSSDRSLASSTAESSLTGGSDNVCPSPTAAKPRSSLMRALTDPPKLVLSSSSSTIPATLTTTNNNNTSSTATPTPVLFRRARSSFLRVADLCMSETSHSTHSDDSSDYHHYQQPHPNYHHAAVDPPPGVDHDPKERWVALDNGAGSHAPIAPFAIQALANIGKQIALQQSMWVPDAKTLKVLKTVPATSWQHCTWQNHHEAISSLPAVGSPEENQVLVWSGNVPPGFYGGDLPAVRAVGIINLSPKDLTDLLVDSSRVKEYNKMSLGRTDLLVLQDDMTQPGPFGKSITKVMKSESRPPLLRKTMQFVSILHARPLDDDKDDEDDTNNDDNNNNNNHNNASQSGGYLVVTRAVTSGDDASLSASDTSILRSEILMGVNLMYPMSHNRSLMINVSHIRSPMVPTMVAKRIGLSAAASFINDLQRAVATLNTSNNNNSKS